MATKGRVLIVCTSASEYDQAGYRTGLWLGELTHFYDALEQAGHPMVIASIAGGQVPLDPESLATAVLGQGGTAERYADRNFMDLLSDTPAVADQRADDFDAIYLTGGHGTMFDYDDPALARLVGSFVGQGKVVSAVCHGPCGLVDVVVAGRPLLEGRKATGFSWTEEKLARRADVVPYNLSEAMKAKGARYTKALRPLGEKVVVDGNLVTGQNPTSAAGVGKAVVKLLKKR